MRLPNEPEWEKPARGGDLVPAHAPVVFSLDQPPDLRRPTTVQARRTRAAQVSLRGRTRCEQGQYYAKIETTSPAGCFPNGASVYGCQDMSGNVWEWTRSAYGPWQLKDDGVHVDLKFKYPYGVGDECESSEGDLQMARVLRGGSFTRSQRNARSACRDWDQHSRVGVHYGFRVVVSPSSL